MRPMSWWKGKGTFMVLSDDARSLQSGLMEQVVVRQFMHPEKGVLNRLLRISIGSPEQNACLLSVEGALMAL